MDDSDWLAARFEEQRPRLRGVAYRMLGSFADADDAVQDAWLRASRAGVDGIDNVGAWLTTIVARASLNQLRARAARGEQRLVPDPVVTAVALTPDEQAELADSVGLALLVVLDTLSPAERLSFVLHDMFDIPFDEIAQVVDRSPAATRQLASRARRQVRGSDIPKPDSDVGRQRAVVDAFFAAARGGDFAALVAVLHPDVVLRSEFGGRRASAVVQGAETVAGQALMFAHPTADLRPVLVNGLAGVVVVVKGKPFAVMGFTVVDGFVASIDAIADPERVQRLASEALAAG